MSSPEYEIATALFCFAPKGASTDGMRIATGTDEPASMGNFISRGNLHHSLGLAPAPRQVLVVEHGYGAPAGAEDVGDFQEHFEARVEALFLVVEGVVAVLADEDDAVDGELVAAEGERVGDGAEDGHAVLLGAFAAHVSFRHLFREHADDLRPRVRRLVVLLVPFQVFADYHVGVRPGPVFGDDRGDALGFSRGGQWQRGGGQKCTALHIRRTPAYQMCYSEDQVCSVLVLASFDNPGLSVLVYYCFDSPVCK